MSSQLWEGLIFFLRQGLILNPELIDLAGQPANTRESVFFHPLLPALGL